MKPSSSVKADAAAPQIAAAPATTVPASPPTVGQGQPPADMFFQDAGDNPIINTSKQPISTFAVDVDTASYTVARNYLTRGTLPPAEAIRVEEFINYFPQQYAAPRQSVAVYIEGAPSLFHTGWHTVQIGLKAREVSQEQRKPAILTFVIDVSGSMEMENRLGLVKQSLNLLLDQLRAEDQVGIVVYGTTAQVWQTHTADKALIRQRVQALASNGSTNAEAGLTLGYDQAYRAHKEGFTNRVILCSDGVANVGNTGPDAMLKRIEDYRTKGITLTTVGFGMGNYNDVLMEKLADKGDGHYAYVDTVAEARRVFLEQVTGTLELVAKDAKIQVQFDPAQVSAYRLVGYENRGMKNEDFRNEKADGGEMGAGHAVTALYEVQLIGKGQPLGRVFVRYKEPTSGETIEVEVPIAWPALAPSAATASARLRWTASVAEFAGILGKSPWAAESNLAGVMETARKAASDLDMPAAHKESLDLMDRAFRLRGAR